MEATLNIPLTVPQLADLIRRQLPRTEQLRLAALLQYEDDTYQEPTKQEILDNLRADFIALNKGTLKTRPLQDILDEIPD